MVSATAGLALHRGWWVFKAGFSSVLLSRKCSIALGGMFLSVSESSRSRDHLTSKCPDVVSQGLLGALQQAQQALSSFEHYYHTGEELKKPLKPCTLGETLR